MNGFYELLQVSPDATPEALRAAYQDQVAQVVRKIRAAEARQHDVSTIEARRAALADAWAVLSDPTRRRRYDRFRELARTGLPMDLEELWAKAGPSLVDPAAAAGLEGVRMLTELRVGEPLAAPQAPAEPDVSPVTVRPAAAQRPAAPAPTATPPEPRATAPRGPTPGAITRPPTAPSAAPSTSAAPPAELTRRIGDVRASAPPAALELDRSVGADRMAQLLDQYGPTGAFLRAAREARRIPLEQLGSTTRVAIRFLDALERDAYTDLPAHTFVRGYVRMVVRALDALPAGPDTDEMIEGYMARFHRARG